MDIGGGHFLDVRRPHVNDFLFSFMPETEWNKFNRDSQIAINGKYINHPFEANIWQMDEEAQIGYLKSIAVAGCNLGTEMPKDFVDWIYWKLGNKIADDYMIPYNQKMFGKNLSLLGTYWLEKLPNVSFEDTLRSCLKHKAYGKQPGHAQFYYPKEFGYGELWKRISDSLGEHIRYNQEITKLDYTSKSVTTTTGEVYQADLIVTTIPWTSIKEIIGMPDVIKASIAALKHSSVQIEYFPDNMDASAHWIYYPNPELSYHRILVRHNFYPNCCGYWTETNTDRIDMAKEKGLYKYVNEYAYPLNTVDKPNIMAELLKWSENHGVIGLGRWGEHQHYNSDVTVERALALAERICKHEC